MIGAAIQAAQHVMMEDLSWSPSGNGQIEIAFEDPRRYRPQSWPDKTESRQMQSPLFADHSAEFH